MEIDYSGLPTHMQAGMKRYIEHGIDPGSFLTAVLSNDLMEAVKRGDSVNQLALVSYVRFLYNEAPAWCYGSPGNYLAWLRHGGLAGGADKEE